MILPIVVIIIPCFVLHVPFNERGINHDDYSTFALIGGIFMVYFYGINLSVAVAVGFIALFGMAIETIC
jgi:Cu(I)/Ag(I) efflux system membrane protein CusA/SilA